MSDRVTANKRAAQATVKAAQDYDNNVVEFVQGNTKAALESSKTCRE
jgi:hypothetical protein